MNRAIAVAFFVSGFAGLMHEVVWSKLLATLIGTTAHAQAAVLAVYMGGLALGSVFFGRRSDRRGNSLRTYMYLEFVIAAYCALLPMLLGGAEDAYVWMAGYAFESSQLKFGLRFAMALLTIILPAVLMGGTLPLLARHSIDRPEETRQRVATLYALNSFGAVAGAAAAGFVTIPNLGVYPSLLVACVMNIVAALLVWPLAWKSDEPAIAEPAAVEATSGTSYPASTYAITLAALFLSGFAAMAYEVVFIRVISLSFGATTFSFTVMLMSFITGIGVGSLLIMQLRIERPLWLLGVFQLCAALAFLLATPLMERLPYYVALVRIAAVESGASFVLYQLGKAALCLAVLLPPTICLGASFPLVTAIQARQPDRIGSLVGVTYAYNTVGNVLGVLVTTLLLFPTIGMPGAFHVAVALSIASGMLVLLVAREASGLTRAAFAAATLLLVGVYVGWGTDWSYPVQKSYNHLRLRESVPQHLSEEAKKTHPAYDFEAWKRRFLYEGQGGAIMAAEEEAHAYVVIADVAGVRSMSVNSKVDASTGANDMETQILVAHLPLFMRPQARSLLVIGHGSGITLGSALRHPIERADVVEISEAVLDLSDWFFAFNYDVLEDPRVEVYLDDAQSFLRTVPHNYDAIISQPSNPWISGIAGLFTTEFFEVARRKLNPGGVFTLWFPEYEQSDEAIRLILRTFRSVFPHVTLFAESNYNDIIAVGSTAPLDLDPAAVEERFDESAVRNDLARLGILNVAALLSHHAIPPADLAKLNGEGPVNSSLRQHLEYEAIRAKFAGKSSKIVENNSPLLNGGEGLFLDDYISYRDAQGEPIRDAELMDAARHMGARSSYGARHREAIMARASDDAPDTPADRTARGAAPNPRTAGMYEAQAWGDRYRSEGDTALARRYHLRALGLRQQAAAEAGVTDE